MITKFAQRLVLMCAAIVLVACSGGGGGGGGGGGQMAGGGVSGTGVGTTTGFGSIIINDVREFDFDDDTRFFRDGVELTETGFMQNGVGMVTRVDIGPDVSADFTSGTAVTVSADNQIKGPVTGTNPLRVLEQIVVVTGDTILDNVPGNDTGNLVLGDIVEVSGFADSNNIFQLTRLEFKAAGTQVWKLTGPASNVIANASFQVGNQLVLLNGVVPRDCGANLNNGELVEVKASEDPGFTPGGDTLDTVTDVECQVPGLGVPGNANGNILDAEVEGIVTTINGPDDYIINGQRVITNAGTLFEGGADEDIVVGSKLEAEGDLNLTTGILTVDKMKFRENRVRIEAPVAPGEVNMGANTLTIMSITVIGTPLTEDDDDIFGSGLGATRQVRVSGFVDGSGQVIVTELEDRGMPEIDEVRLRGPINNTVNPTFEILGVIVDTATANSIFDETVGPPPEMISPTEFFNRVSTGTNVQVENGMYNSGPNSITDGDIEIED